jgi:hypothetical protein
MGEMLATTERAKGAADGVPGPAPPPHLARARRPWPWLSVRSPRLIPPLPVLRSRLLGHPGAARLTPPARTLRSFCPDNTIDITPHSA